MLEKQSQILKILSSYGFSVEFLVGEKQNKKTSTECSKADPMTCTQHKKSKYKNILSIFKLFYI